MNEVHFESIINKIDLLRSEIEKGIKTDVIEISVSLISIKSDLIKLQSKIQL